MSVSPGFVGPPDPASLSGTLSGMDVLSQIIAAQEEERKRLAEQTQNANQQAGQAQQQYQEASQAPPPDVGAMQAFLPTLLGNVASVLGQNPTYQENAQQRLKTERSNLLQTRADNLAQLRNVWNQKAEAAQKAGDLETTLTARQKSEQLSKVHADLLQQQRIDAAQTAQDKNLQAAEDRQRRALEAAAAAADAKAKAQSGQENVDFLTNEIKTSTTGRQFLPMTNVKGKMTGPALAFAKEKGIPAVNANDAGRLDKLDVARQNLDDMIGSLRTFLPKDENDVGTMTANTYHNLRGSGNPEIRTWRNYYDGLIGQLVALAGGEGSGVRINKAEIDRQIATAPSIRTPLPIAEKWAQRVTRMIDNAEKPVLGRTNLPGPSTAATTTTETTPTGKTVTLYKNGVAHDIPADKVADAIKNYGYSRGR